MPFMCSPSTSVGKVRKGVTCKENCQKTIDISVKSVVFREAETNNNIPHAV